MMNAVLQGKRIREILTSFLAMGKVAQATAPRREFLPYRHVYMLAVVAIVSLAPQISVGDGEWMPTGEADIYGNAILTNTVDNATYQFLVSGNPEAVATEKSNSLPSSGTSFASGTISIPTSAISVEARYRTWLESAGTDVDSTKFCGSVIIVF